MLAALVVNRLCPDRKMNMEAVFRLAGEAVKAGAALVLFPEAALTGLINNDDPEHDLPLGETSPGPATEAIALFAKQNRTWLGIGMLERDEDCLYDSAVLFGPDGTIRLHYRRKQPQWHGRKASPAIYRQGTTIPIAMTPFGSVAFLICGDLFDDDIVGELRSMKPDWVLLPFARCFGKGEAADQGRWDKEELPLYLERVRKLSVPTLATNYVGAGLPEDNSFGGAFFASADGTLLASLPLGMEGCLIIDLDDASKGRKSSQD